MKEFHDAVWYAAVLVLAIVAAIRMHAHQVRGEEDYALVFLFLACAAVLAVVAVNGRLFS